MSTFRLSILISFFCLTLWSEDDFSRLQIKADNGDSQAAYELAEALYWANGVDRDLSQAADYALVGSLKGNPLAQYRYSVMQLLGHGVKQDVRAGLKLLSESAPGLQQLAEENNPDALFIIGQLHQLGLMKANGFKPDYKKSLVNLQAAAELGHAKAAFLAARLFTEGVKVNEDVVVPRNTVKAITFYKDSASRGYALAAYYLARMHDIEGGKIVSQKDALLYLKQAADSGLVNAQREYGKALGEGKLGLKENKEAALSWIRKAAKQGDEECIYLIGLMYFTGSEYGVKRDLEQAYFWLSIAARSSDASINKRATNRINKLQDLFVKSRDEYTTKLELELLKQVDKLKASQLDILKRVRDQRAEQTILTANTSMGLEGAAPNIQHSIRVDHLISNAESGDSMAMLGLGNWYLEQKESVKAEGWLNKSAQKGNVKAMLALGDQYIHGGFGERDFKEGSQWLKRAAAKGSIESMNILGGMAKADMLPGGKPADAALWFRQAAEKGDAEAQTRLGGLLYNGEVVKQDLKGGKKWIEKAAAQNYPNGQGALAAIYAEGKLDGPDYKKAAKWARRAAMQGDAVSQRLLGYLYLEGKGVLPSKLPKRIDHMRHAYRWLILSQRAGVLGLEPAMNALQKRLEVADIKIAVSEADQFVAEDHYNFGMDSSGKDQNDLESIIIEANQGKAHAQLALARRFNNGAGVEIDLIKAYVWYTLALNQGNEEALKGRSRMIKAHGMGIDDIVAAKKQVRAFKPKP